MSDHIVFNVINGGVSERRGFHRSRVLEFTLLDSTNQIVIKGIKEPLQVTDSAQDIARALGVWQPLILVESSQIKGGQRLSVHFPLELLANSSFYEETSGQTRILTPDGQSLAIDETKER